MYGQIVMDVPAERFDEALGRREAANDAESDTDLDAAALRALTEEFREIARRETGRDFPSDPKDQLDLAIKAVFASWFGKRARDYRQFNAIADDLGTAVNVVPMVFGNMGDYSGTGVAFTRDPNTGEKRLYGEFLVNAQGEDVVAGIRTPRTISELADAMPKVYREFEAIAERLERHYRDVQDLEFTIERGHLYMLQTRSAKRTAAAAVKIAVDMVSEGIISKPEDTVQRIEPAYVDQLLRDQFDPRGLKAAKHLARGLNASPGAAVGKAVFDSDRAAEQAAAGEHVLLVRIETSPDDFHGMAASQGVLTARGGATSHAAVVAREIGKPCVAGVGDLVIDYAGKRAQLGGETFVEGDWLSLNGSTGDVYLGQVPTIQVHFEDQHGLREILGWADEIRRLQVWTNADKPEEAALARTYGAQGIGLCRTEHMFREGERLEIVRDAILVAFAATRAKERREAGAELSAEETGVVERFDAALGKLEKLQQRDFEGILDGRRRAARDHPADRSAAPRVPAEPRGPADRDRAVPGAPHAARTIRRSRRPACSTRPGSRRSEQNARMLGLRGIRLRDHDPRLHEDPQTRAVLNAAIAVKRAGADPHPRDHDSARRPRDRAAADASRSSIKRGRARGPRRQDDGQDFKFGTMIEYRGPAGSPTRSPTTRRFSASGRTI